MINLNAATYSSESGVNFDFKSLDLSQALAVNNFWIEQKQNPYVPSINSLTGPSIDWPSHGKFTWSLEFKRSKLKCVELQPMFGPLSSGDWQDASLENLYEQVLLMKNFVQKVLQRNPDEVSSLFEGSENLRAYWYQPWGKLAVGGEARSYWYGITLEQFSKNKSN
jgi:hypothetical protein